MMAGRSCLTRSSPTQFRTTHRTTSLVSSLAVLVLVTIIGGFFGQASGLQCDILRPYSNEHFSLFTTNSLGYIVDSQFDPTRLWFVQPDTAGYRGDDLSHYTAIENSTVVQVGVGPAMFPALHMNETSSVASFRAEHLAGNWSRPFTTLLRIRLSNESTDRNTAIISQQRYPSTRASRIPDSGFALTASGDMKAVIVLSGDIPTGTLIIARSTDPVFVAGLWHVVAVSVSINRSPFARLFVDGVEIPLVIRTSLDHISELVPDTSEPERLVIGRWSPIADCTPQISDIGDLIFCDDDLADDRMACMHEYYFGISDGVSPLSTVSGVFGSFAPVVHCTESIPSKSSSATPTPSITPSPSRTASSSPSYTATISATVTVTPTFSSTPSSSISVSRTVTPSATSTASNSPTMTKTASRTPSITPTRSPAVLPSILNPSFETPARSSFIYTTVDNWAGTYVVIPSGSGPWGGMGAAAGSQYIGLQAVGTIIVTQTVSGFTFGARYTIQYYDASRPGYAVTTLQFSVLVSSTSTVIAQTGFLSPVTGSWTNRSLSFTATSSSLTLKFQATGTGTDRTPFIDGVRIAIGG